MSQAQVAAVLDRKFTTTEEVEAAIEEVSGLEADDRVKETAMEVLAMIRNTLLPREAKAPEDGLTKERWLAHWKAFDNTVRTYERQFRIQLTKAFQDLQRETLDALKALKEG